MLDRVKDRAREISGVGVDGGGAGDLDEGGVSAGPRRRRPGLCRQAGAGRPEKQNVDVAVAVVACTAIPVRRVAELKVSGRDTTPLVFTNRASIQIEDCAGLARERDVVVEMGGSRLLATEKERSPKHLRRRRRTPSGNHFERKPLMGWDECVDEISARGAENRRAKPTLPFPPPRAPREWRQ
jgi:hypothetical protein